LEVSLINSVTPTRAQESFQLKQSVQESNKIKTLLPKNILADGEVLLYESSASLWTIFIAPCSLFIIGLLILASGNWLPFGEMNTFLALPSDNMLLKSTVKWFGVLFLAISITSCFLRGLRWRSTIYAATNRRFLRQTGVLSRCYIDCAIWNIQMSHLQIPLSGRIFNFGTIKVSTASNDCDELQWEGINKPAEAYRKLNMIIDNFK
jgi:hypothetical protein